MKSILKTLNLFCLLVSNSFSEVIVPDIISYDKPDFLFVAKRSASSTDDPYSGVNPIIEYLGKKNSYESFQQLNIGIRTVGYTVKEGKVVEFSKLTQQDLKDLMLKTLSGKGPNKPKVEEITTSGLKAYRLYSEVPMPQVRKGVIFHFEFIWVQVAPNRVVQLNLVGSDKALLKSLRDTLSTIKIQKIDTNKEKKVKRLPITKGVPKLGDHGNDVFKSLGKSIQSGPSSSLYYTGDYFMILNYSMPNITDITYLRSKDPEKFVTAYIARNKKGFSISELEHKEIQKLLSHHIVDSKGTKLIWKSTGKNSWERSDGALAKYFSERKILMITTKAESKKIIGW